MKYGLVKSVVLLSATAATSALIGRAVINTFAFDIFSKCINNPLAESEFICRNASDLIQFYSITIAAMLFFITLVIFFVEKQTRKQSLIKVGALSIIYYGLMLASWRYLVDLQVNFAEFYQLRRGIPESFSEYAVSFYSRTTDVVVGVIMGFMVWLPGKVNSRAIDAAKRKEPRIKFVNAKVDAEQKNAKQATEKASTEPTKNTAAKAKTTKKATKSTKKTSSKTTAAKKTTTKKTAAKKSS